MCDTASEYEKSIRAYLDWIFFRPNFLEVTEGVGINIVKPFANYIKSKHNNNFLFKTPLYGWWDLTSKCNLRCLHCLYSTSEYSSKYDLNTKQALSLADELIDLGVIQIVLTGGEIFTRPDAMKIIRRFKQNNVAVKLLTNALLLNDKMIDEIAEMFDYYVDNIHISLDGATRETYKKIRRVDGLEKVIKNTKKLAGKGVRVINVCTVNKFNYDEVIDTYKLSADIGASFFAAGRTYSYTKEQDELIVPDRDIVVLIKNLLEINNKEPKTGLIPSFYTMMEFLNLCSVKEIIEEEKYQNVISKYTKPLSCNCHSHDRFRVKSNGDISLCMQTDEISGAQLGNYKQNSFSEIWNRRLGNQYFTIRDCNKMSCFGCKYNVICNAGCQIKAFQDFGTLNHPQIDCVLSK